MSSNGKQTTQSIESSAEPKSDPLESGACRDIYRELTSLTSQVKMMSDSLAACKQMSKHRPLRKMYSTKGKSQPDDKEPQGSVQALLTSDHRSLDSNQENTEEHTTIVSYMINKTSSPLKSKSGSEFKSDSQNANSSQRCGSLMEVEMSQGHMKGISKIHTYDHKEVNPIRMIDVIQRELKTLMESAPPVALLVTALCDTIVHYKECDRCSEKISPFLPWILYRIQKLIKYVTTKRKRNYLQPDDYSYLCLRPSELAAGAHNLPLKVSRRPVAKLEKVNAFSAIENTLGVQLLLEVKPKKTRKRFFDRAENYSVSHWNSFQNFAVVELREPESVPVIQVLQLSCKPKILLIEKREALQLKELSYSLRMVFGFQLGFLASLMVLSPVPVLTRTETDKIGFRPKSSSQQDAVQLQKNFDDLLPGNKDEKKSESLTKLSDDSDQFSQKNILARVSEIVQEFLQEGEKEKMHEKVPLNSETFAVQNLEAGVKVLRDIMMEVHKNQVALSKVLLEKSIYSQSIFRLTDPSMLEKENEMVRQVAEIQVPISQSFSIEALQVAMKDLVLKCRLKNRMIMITLKGLRSNIPKEWWEGMVEYVFNESKVVEDFNPEKLSEFVEKTSSLSALGEKNLKPQARELRNEELLLEEELKMKGNGEEFDENLKKFSRYDGKLAKVKNVASLNNFSDSPANILVFPATDESDFFGNSIRKLENQVSLLNTENERLWHEIYDLKNLLKNSVRDFNERRISRIKMNQQALNLQLPTKTSGKTINLTIEIVDKDFRRLKGFGFQRKISQISVSNGEKPISPPGKYRRAEFLTEVEDSKTEKSGSDQNVRVVSEEPLHSIRSKSYRWHSENDLNYLDSTSAGVIDYRQENEKLKSVLKERTIMRNSDRPMHELVMATPLSSGREPFQKLKQVLWVPSKYMIPEVKDDHQAGPSRKQNGVDYILQKPSLMKLTENQSPKIFSTMANERELQTIPENDCGPFPNSKGIISQEIQRLRTRVRSIHKDVTVLKSKNDHVDKLLNRLMDDAAESTQSFEEIKHDFNRLKNQLG